MKHFVKNVNDLSPLTIFAKSSTLDVRLGSEYTSVPSAFKNKLFITTPVWALRLKFVQNKKLTIFNKIRPICNFVPIIHIVLSVKKTGVNFSRVKL